MLEQPHIPAQRGNPSANVFVGRRQEMSGLKSALDEARNGHPRLEMLAGEPGIGKTRIAEELALHAGDQGVQVLWGSFHEGEGAPPYWAWVQQIREYISRTDSDQLKAEIDAGAAEDDQAAELFFSLGRSQAAISARF